MSKRDCSGKTPNHVGSEPQVPRSPTCHGCLLHPPPLVDLAQDLRILGFFLPVPGGPFYCALQAPRRSDSRSASLRMACPARSSSAGLASSERMLTATPATASGLRESKTGAPKQYMPSRTASRSIEYCRWRI